jgi:hypothetical protein
MKDRKFKFINVKQVSTNPEKRRAYSIFNNEVNVWLGDLLWSSFGKQYVFFPQNTVLPTDCLRDIVKCLNELNKEAK